MFTTSVAILALAAQALASVNPTSPFASTTCTGGQQCKIIWNDDGKAPPLAQFGTAHVGLFVGGPVQQVEVQPIADNVDVTSTQEIDFTVNPAIGPNGNMYFIRFISSTAKDPNFQTQPLSAFSAKFNLAGMSGTFNTTVQQIVDSANSSAGSSPTAAGAPAATTPAAAGSTTPAASPAAASSAKPSSSAPASKSGSAGAAQSTNGATSRSVASAFVLFGVAAIALAL